MNTDNFTFPCPACGHVMRSTSCRAINAHQRSAKHRAAIQARGFPTSGLEWEDAERTAWTKRVTTPGGSDK